MWAAGMTGLIFRSRFLLSHSRSTAENEGSGYRGRGYGDCPHVQSAYYYD
jgi:hypothetical protein